ncbi:MAG: tryptophan synthase subunit alpha [Candidatus Nitrohelix vancouverensis]|uniref:Tryptophan synthase alpha chain n=1 Tax=Candidatus Nitrohelix vancouverensis TaxID=2705534 RepID=A0A7T0G3R2_9BACT|nr:MAG: tryptophan synthase subunit alpha [Candidatus Nitrohelix vancouverensis]
MSRLQQRFEKIKSEGSKALAAFITAGDPSLEATVALFREIEKNGADIVELGVPFSDPLADGPVIQASAQRALKAGTTLKKIIALVSEIRKESELPIVLMTSFNPVYVYGQEAFVQDAAAAGVDGLIIPDLPPEEAETFQPIAEAKGIDLIFLLAPTSSDARIQMIARRSRGFLYYISLTGTTGTRTALATGLKEKMQAIRSQASLPALVGFGISSPEQAAEAAQVSDGVIVGSAIVKIIEKEGASAKGLEQVGQLVSAIKQAIAGPST